MNGIKTTLDLSRNSIQAQRLPVIDKSMPSLKAEIVHDEDRRVKKRRVLPIERTVDEDPRRTRS